jgi:hypothetical protein
MATQPNAADIVVCSTPYIPSPMTVIITAMHGSPSLSRRVNQVDNRFALVAYAIEL